MKITFTYTNIKNGCIGSRIIKDNVYKPSKLGTIANLNKIVNSIEKEVAK